MQDILTASLEVVTVSFALVMIFDFISGLKRIAQPAQFQSRVTEPEAIALGTETLDPPGQLPDPRILPAGEIPVKPHKPVPAPLESTPLLLPQAKEVAQPPLPTSAKPTLDELLAGVDLNTLQLRPARKIAKVLGVAQKIGGKDQPLSWLRAQIKKRLEQAPTETAQVIGEVLKAS